MQNKWKAHESAKLLFFIEFAIFYSVHEEAKNLFEKFAF